LQALLLLRQRLFGLLPLLLSLLRQGRCPLETGVCLWPSNWLLLLMLLMLLLLCFVRSRLLLQL
jgi:hypothetical protein